MAQLPKITGKVIGFFEAFKGSRAAYNSEKILIVRGISNQNIAIDEMENKLIELGKILGGKELDPFSDAGKNFVDRIDSQMREEMEITTAPDTGGILRMKEDLESMGLSVQYKLFKMKHAGAFIAIWKDKSGNGPLYVEVTVSDNEQ